MEFKELKTKSEAEIGHNLAELRAEAHDISVKIKLNQLKNNHKLKLVKKDIARILTYLQQKVANSK